MTFRVQELDLALVAGRVSSRSPGEDSSLVTLGPHVGT